MKVFNPFRRVFREPNPTAVLPTQYVEPRGRKDDADDRRAFAQNEALWPNSPTNVYLSYGSRYGIQELDLNALERNSMCWIVARWLATAVASVPYTLTTLNGREIANHPALDVRRKPGFGWSHSQMMQAIVRAMLYYGNAYLVIGDVGFLQFIDPRRVNIYQGRYHVSANFRAAGLGIGDSRDAVYTPEQIVHLRYTRSDNATTKGIGPMQIAIPEVATDDEARQYTTSMLHNSGTAGLIASPKEDAAAPDPGEAEDIRNALNRMISGQGVGTSVVLEAPYLIHEPRNSIERLDMRSIRYVPEERIAACAGMPPAVLNVGTGSEQTRVGRSVDALVEVAWVDAVMPLVVDIAEQLSMQWLQPIMSRGNLKFTPNFDGIPVLQAAQERSRRALYERLDIGVKGGFLTVDEAREELGYPPLPKPEPPPMPAEVVEVDTDDDDDVD